MKKSELMNLNNARSEDQLIRMKRLKNLGVCIFCKKHLEKYSKVPIIKDGKYWVIRKNDYPYEGSKIHLLLVYKKHIDSIEKISKEAMLEFFDYIKWVNKKFKIPGATILMRSNDSKYTGATITHLHTHIISGYPKNKKSKPILAAVGFTK